MEWTKERSLQVLAQIIERSKRDPAFRRKCLTDPAAAVEEASGQKLPAGFKIRFVDNDDADITVVLPDPPAKELSDEALSAVAGGLSIESAIDVDRVVVRQGSCFAAGTPVLMADGTSRKIEDLAVGDVVLGYSEERRTVTTGAVTKVICHDPEPIHRMLVDGVADPIFLTPNHPFRVGGEWRQIRDVPIGAELYHYDPKLHEASPRRLAALERTSRIEAVYNVEVDGVHSYFAHRLLVHNGRIGGVGGIVGGTK